MRLTLAVENHGYTRVEGSALASGHGGAHPASRLRHVHDGFKRRVSRHSRPSIAIQSGKVNVVLDFVHVATREWI